MSKKRGSAWLMVLVVAGIVIAALYVFGAFSKTAQPSKSRTLTDSEVGGFTTVLHDVGVQAAVIQKIEDDNTGSVWIVKADGERIFLYNVDLGTGHDSTGAPLPYSTFDMVSGAATGVALLPDQAQVFDEFSHKLWDISKYVSGHTPDENWSNIYLATQFEMASGVPTVTGSLAQRILSPSGHFAINVSSTMAQETTLEKIQVQGNDIVAEPIPISTSTYGFLGWSMDERYALMGDGSVYDTQAGKKMSGLFGTSTRALADIDGPLRLSNRLFPTLGPTNPFIVLLPSVILFEISSVHGGITGERPGGIYYIATHLGSVVQTAPNEIKMVGLIQ